MPKCSISNVSRRFLVTGGAGFIGSNFIRYLLRREPRSIVINLDNLSYAGVKSTVDELDADPRHRFVHGDIRDETLVGRILAEVDVVVNFAAESHVDRSLREPSRFLETNALGTGVLIEGARRSKVTRFIHVSTDEVYGSIDHGQAAEDSILRPSSPYSASKAAGDLIVLAFEKSFEYPAIVTRCTNNFGPYQHPEKMIPLLITNLLRGRKLPLYGDGLNQRDWLYVDDHCSALYLLIDHGEAGIYNIGANVPLANTDLARAILRILGASDQAIEYVADRPGHDFRYAVDTKKLRRLGWAPSSDFADALNHTVDWYMSRQDWWLPLTDPS